VNNKLKSAQRWFGFEPAGPENAFGIYRHGDIVRAPGWIAATLIAIAMVMASGVDRMPLLPAIGCGAAFAIALYRRLRKTPKRDELRDALLVATPAIGVILALVLVPIGWHALAASGLVLFAHYTHRAKPAHGLLCIGAFWHEPTDVTTPFTILAEDEPALERQLTALLDHRCGQPAQLALADDDLVGHNPHWPLHHNLDVQTNDTHSTTLGAVALTIGPFAPPTNN
jgi:hypothetical protein